MLSNEFRTDILLSSPSHPMARPSRIYHLGPTLRGSVMEDHQIIHESHSPIHFTFITETFPPEQYQPEPQQFPQLTPQVDAPQVDTVVAYHPLPTSEFSQDFYTEANTRRVQPPRARRTDFGKHTADELIIDAIERAEKEKPVIPPETAFFCTTDNSMMPNMHEILASIHPAGTDSADELPMHSYFRDPEVMRKIRSQEMIETPSWRPATQDDWDNAMSEIPEDWREYPPDTSFDYYRRSHIKMERMEAMVRNREKSKLAHDYHHLKARLAELQQLDASGFRGETFAEQEKDKVLVLSAAKKLLENQRVKGEVKEKDSGDGAGDGVEAVKDDDGTASNRTNVAKPPRKKKESKYIYYPVDFDPNEEIIGDTSKKKKSKKKPPVRSDRAAPGASKKRKLEETEMEIDDYFVEDLVPEPEGEEDEYLEGAERLASLKKLKAPSAQKRPIAPYRAAGFPLRDKEKDEKASKLLDTAKKYNPKRTPRDIHPFGAPLPELGPQGVDFDLPPWLGWELGVGDSDAATPAVMQGDEPMDTFMPTMEMDLTDTINPRVPNFQEVPAAVEHGTMPLEAEEVAANFMETISHPDSYQFPLKSVGSSSRMEDAESSGLSELSDEDRDTSPGEDGATLEGQEDEVVDAMEEEEGEDTDAYASPKPPKPRRSIARGSSSKNKKARRR